MEQYLPYTSEDIDLLGGKIEARQAKEALGGVLVLNKDFDPSPNSGILTTQLGNQKLRLDFLSTVYGLDEEEIVRSALTYQGTGKLQKVQIKVQNPILCLEGKLKSVQAASQPSRVSDALSLRLCGLPQFGRQDLRHLKMSILFSREYLQDICQQSPPRTELKLIERIYNRAKRDAGLSVWLQHRVAVESTIPLKAIAQLDNKSWLNFYNIRLPQLERELTDKRTKYQQFEQSVIH